MKAFGTLFKGELVRLARYNIISASLFVAAFWIAVLHFSEIPNLTGIFVLVLLIDTTVMAMLLVGVTMFFEKDEGAIRSLLVSPITKTEYVLAKSAGNLLSNVQTLVILYAYARFFREIDVALLPLLPAILLIGAFHCLMGFLVAYRSRDFTDLLTGIVKYTLVVMLPVALESVGLIQNQILESLMYLLPTKAAIILIGASAGEGAPWEIGYSAVYLAVGTAVLARSVLAGFDAFAARESGV